MCAMTENKKSAGLQLIELMLKDHHINDRCIIYSMICISKEVREMVLKYVTRLKINERNLRILSFLPKGVGSFVNFETL
eukprot:Pgem_evm1s6577